MTQYQLWKLLIGLAFVFVVFGVSYPDGITMLFTTVLYIVVAVLSTYVLFPVRKRIHGNDHEGR